MTDVREFGAVGDGVYDDHAAFQKALDNNDGLVLIPDGQYKIGVTLKVSSNTEIKALRNAYIFFADGAGKTNQDFLLTNADHVNGNENILVQGGIWDGNNPGNPRGPDAPDSYTGVLMNFIHVKSLTVRKLTVRDAESYFIRIGEAYDFVVWDVRFESPNMRPNQDGVHLGGHCEKGYIVDLTGVGEATNDDLVALNADDALQRAQNLDLKCGPIQHIHISRIKAESCHSFVRLLSVRSRISDIKVKDIEGGCRCMAVNMDGCRECRVKLFDPADPQYAHGVGDIKSVHIQNMRVHKTSAEDQTPLINFRSNVHNFRIEGFERNTQLDQSPDAPTISFRECGKTQMTLSGLQDKHALAMELSSGAQGIDDGSSFQLDLPEGAEMKLLFGGFEALRVDRGLVGQNPE